MGNASKIIGNQVKNIIIIGTKLKVLISCCQSL